MNDRLDSVNWISAVDIKVHNIDFSLLYSSSSLLRWKLRSFCARAHFSIIHA